MAYFLAFSGNMVLGFELLTCIKVLVTLFAAVLFLQSGADKVLDWSGNRSYISGIFGKTIFRPFVPVLLPTISLLEGASGLFSIAGSVVLLADGSETLAVTGLVLGAISILLLFTGLRIAKDYGAAAGITPYFIFFVLALALFAL